jgi:hypothetical protein
MMPFVSGQLCKRHSPSADTNRRAEHVVRDLQLVHEGFDTADLKNAKALLDLRLLAGERALFVMECWIVKKILRGLRRTVSINRGAHVRRCL